MNLEPVSVESPRVVPSPPSCHRKLTQRAVFDNESCRGSAQTASELLLKQILIEIALEKIAAHGLCGAEHVGPYLMDLYRRNCRPNTIRSRFATIFVFLQYLKAKGRNLLELACREDVCAFIEQEQDRGLKPASVSCRVDALYAFIGFWVEREVLCPELLKRKLRVKVPERLPRAIDPEDVRRLLAVIRHPRDRAMVLLLLRTGMRIGELLHTTLFDVNLAEMRIEIFETQKNRVGRVVYLAEDACQALEHWLEVRRRKTALIFSGQAGRPLSYEVARSRFVALLHRADLAYKGFGFTKVRKDD